MTYAWDFGVPGTGDTSTQQDPSFTYTTPGNYTATVTVTDAAGGKASATVEVRVTRPLDECPTGPVRSDEFDGTTLDLDRWELLRPGRRAPAQRLGRQAEPADRQRLHVRRRHVGGEPGRPGRA